MNEHDRLVALTEVIDSRDKRIAELENEQTKGIHSCSHKCQRPLCVAQRYAAHLEQVIKDAGHAEGCAALQTCMADGMIVELIVDHECDCFKSEVE